MDWSAIHAEKYWVTPEVVFEGMVLNAESLMRKQADEERRRLAWLQREIVDTDESVTLRVQKGDAYNCNPDRFKDKTGRLPHGWKKAVQTASWVHIDEMRTLLELHYGRRAPSINREHRMLAQRH